MDRPYSVTHFKNEIWDGYYIPQLGVRYAHGIHTRYVRLDFFSFLHTPSHTASLEMVASSCELKPGRKVFAKSLQLIRQDLYQNQKLCYCSHCIVMEQLRLLN